MKLNPLLIIPAMFPWSANTAAGQIDVSLDLNLEVRRLGEDQKVNLGEAYRGKVLLIVNTASKCGFTGQYEGLEKLYDQYLLNCIQN